MKERKLKILHTEASNGWGGQEIRIHREAIGMRERGYECIIAAHPKSQIVLHAKREGFRTEPVDFKRRNFMHKTIIASGAYCSWCN